MNEQVKAVWKDDNQNKSIKGKLISENDLFLIVKTKDGTEITISKKYLVSIFRFGGYSNDPR